VGLRHYDDQKLPGARDEATALLADAARIICADFLVDISSSRGDRPWNIASTVHTQMRATVLKNDLAGPMTASFLRGKPLDRVAQPSRSRRLTRFDCPKEIAANDSAPCHILEDEPEIPHAAGDALEKRGFGTTFS